ncbi:MAG: S9 family peptidase [Candidatus Aminicenantes bacterium]|nr:S9 family peptidase [Candidatus Aminicenantes bacterium]
MVNTKTKKTFPGKKEPKACGSWSSSITADMIAGGAVSFKDLVVEGDNIFWVESRPDEQGRYVVMRYSAGEDKKEEKIKNITPNGFSARSIIYSYGGGALAVSGDTVYFSNYNPATYPKTADQRIFKQSGGKMPEPITPEVFMSYGNGIIDENRKRMICVKEDHSVSDENGFPVVSIVAIDLEGEEPEKVLVPGRGPGNDFDSGTGYDFYSSPCLSPDGKKLAYLAWNFPRMPWDSNELWIADIKDGLPENHQKIAGNTSELFTEESIQQKIVERKCEPLDDDWFDQPQSLYQPQWSPCEKYLYFVSDVDNWWHIYRYDINKKEKKVEKVTCNAPENSEFGLPQWYMSMPTYDFLPDNKIVAAYNKEGEWHLAIFDPDKPGKFVSEDIELTGIKGFKAVATEISHVRVTASGQVIFIAGCYNHPTSVVSLDPKTWNCKVLHMSMKAKDFDDIRKYLATPVPIDYHTGTYMKDHSFAFYYYPKNPKYKASDDGEKPPLLLLAHGGPTAAAGTNLNLEIQYFTSRGIAVADVNYRGSNGYGREYRLSLYYNWGVYDRDDCVNCAKYLATEEAAEKIAAKREVEKEKIKPIDIERVLTRGGSAGGYLTLVLATFTDICKAGASYYGVSDLITLTEGTHKFEAHYLDEVTGPYPEERKKYMMRSPIYGLELLDTPLIFFQGEEDKVVPPEQSRKMFEAVKEKGVPTAYKPYANEQHGFRIAKNKKDSLEQEFYFYSRILDFEPADKPEEPVKIYNWPPNK